tara:strand:- start:2282 stop:2662 length:381 start_codon:yes stop_codon:yes gene_type:complete
MKLYSNVDFSLSSLNQYEKTERKCVFLISNEGIFVEKNKKIYKMKIIQDDVEYINNTLIFDKSIIEYVLYDKIPFKYTMQEYTEFVYKIAENLSIVSVDDTILYAEFNSMNQYAMAEKTLTNLFKE